MPCGLLEVEVARLQNSQDIKVINLSVLHIGTKSNSRYGVHNSAHKSACFVPENIGRIFNETGHGRLPVKVG